MKKIETKLPGVYIIEPQVFGDQRGYFMETWSTRNFEEMGLHYDFVQDNQSYSARKGSPTYKKWVAVELSAENKRMLMIPRGFGHGFKTLSDDVEFCYKVDQLYSKECDRGIRFDDPTIGVEWGEVKEELLSAKDTTAPLLDESDCNFEYSELG